MKILVYGLVTGLLFGFLLQKGRVLRYDKQVGALRLQDMTIVKFMLSSVIVGMVGIYLLSDLGLAKLSIKAAILDPPSSAPLFSVWVGVFSGIARALPPGLYRSARRPSR